MDDNTPATEMLFNEALRMLTRQEANLDTLRTQAVALLSVASLVAGLFGSRLLPGNHSCYVLIVTGIALALFGMTAILAVIVLLPRNWDFTHGLDKNLEKIQSQAVIAPINLMFTWTKNFEDMRSDNQVTLDCLTCLFWWACVLSGLQVIAWGIAVF